MPMQRGTRWQGSAMVNGERKRIAFSTRQEAERFEADPYAYLSVTKDAYEIGKLFPTWARQIWGKTRNERNALRITDELVKRLKPRTAVAKIDRAMIRSLVSELKQAGNKDGTINTKLGKLSCLLSYAVDEGVINDRPKVVFFSTPEGRVRSLSPEEEENIFSYLTPRHKDLAVFLLYTGCRVGEALTLTWTDVKEDRVTFWKTKTDRPRTVPLTKQSKESLDKSKSSNLSKPFADIKYGTFLAQWKTAQKKAGLAHDKQAIPHILRHTCATRLAQAGLDPMRMMLWLGHSNIKTTMRYTHMNVEDLKQGVKLLEKTH